MPADELDMLLEGDALARLLGDGGPFSASSAARHGMLLGCGDSEEESSLQQELLGLLDMQNGMQQHLAPTSGGGASFSGSGGGALLPDRRSYVGEAQCPATPATPAPAPLAGSSSRLSSLASGCWSPEASAPAATAPDSPNCALQQEQAAAARLQRSWAAATCRGRLRPADVQQPQPQQQQLSSDAANECAQSVSCSSGAPTAPAQVAAATAPAAAGAQRGAASAQRSMGLGPAADGDEQDSARGGTAQRHLRQQAQQKQQLQRPRVAPPISVTSFDTPGGGTPPHEGELSCPSLSMVALRMHLDTVRRREALAQPLQRAAAQPLQVARSAAARYANAAAAACSGDACCACPGCWQGMHNGYAREGPWAPRSASAAVAMQAQPHGGAALSAGADAGPGDAMLMVHGPRPHQQQQQQSTASLPSARPRSMSMPGCLPKPMPAHAQHYRYHTHHQQQYAHQQHSGPPPEYALMSDAEHDFVRGPPDVASHELDMMAAACGMDMGPAAAAARWGRYHPYGRPTGSGTAQPLAHAAAPPHHMVQEPGAPGSGADAWGPAPAGPMPFRLRQRALFAGGGPSGVAAGPSAGPEEQYQQQQPRRRMAMPYWAPAFPGGPPPHAGANLSMGLGLPRVGPYPPGYGYGYGYGRQPPAGFYPPVPVPAMGAGPGGMMPARRLPAQPTHGDWAGGPPVRHQQQPAGHMMMLAARHSSSSNNLELGLRQQQRQSVALLPPLRTAMA